MKKYLMFFANKSGSEVALIYPFWRAIVFPFYTIRQVFFVLTLVVAISAVMFLIDAPGPIIQYAIAAYIGAALMSYLASPSHLERPASDSIRIETFLRNEGLVFDEDQEVWLPEFPKILLYSHTCLQVQRKNGQLRIEGPYGFLIQLRNWLELK
jgi:hypothetical protein